MVRVAEPGGRVVVVDVYTSSPEQAEAYDHVERLRDPSHVRALGLGELTGLFRGRRPFGRDHRALQARRGPGGAPGRLVARAGRRGARSAGSSPTISGGIDWASVPAVEDGEIRFAFPTAIVVGRKPG